MRIKAVQMSLSDIYDGVLDSIEQKKPALIELLEQHIDFNQLIPIHFACAFYKTMGRNHIYHLESFLRALILQKLLGFTTDVQLIAVLKCSRELQAFCGFSKIPDASQLTRFKQNYCEFLVDVFQRLVDLTEPICREINQKKADYLIFDTTGIEPRISENNPKFMTAKLKEAKKFAKNKPDYNPYRGVYALLPDAANANHHARQQYINGHYCYAMKAGIITNGLGILRHIAFFDDKFKKEHPQTISPKTDNPDADKEISDSIALKPVLSDFFKANPNMYFSTFIGDSAFDSYDNYTLLKDEFHFQRACIALNPRNSKTSNVSFDASGTPVCPKDGTPFQYLGKSGGVKRSLRFKWVCHKSVAQGNTRVLTCEQPCTNSAYGKCTYTYPHKDFRLYPGIPRGTEHWDNLYRHRLTIERTINLMKDSFALAARRNFHTITLKADLYLAGIVQLIGVLLANALHKPHLIKSIRRLIA